MNHSTHMNLTICTWPIQSLVYKLKRTRVLFLGAAITIPATSFAQKHVVENVAKRDSVCRKEQKALSDTTACYLYLRFQGFSLLILKRKEQEKRFNPKALSWPKFDPDKEKFNNLQLINILGEHLLRWTKRYSHVWVCCFSACVLTGKQNWKRKTACYTHQ